MSTKPAGSFAFILRLVGSFLRMSRGYRRLISLIPANGEIQDDGSQSKRKCVLSRIHESGEGIDATNNILGGLHDFLCGLTDLMDCAGGAQSISYILRAIHGVAARFLRRWSMLLFLRVYHRRGTKQQQETSAEQDANQAPAKPSDQPHRVVCNTEEAVSAVFMWRKDKVPIDIPDSMAPELAENIWQIFLEHGVAEVIETAPLLAGKIGQQKILREKVKSTRVRLEAKEEHMRSLEDQLNAIRADISSYEDQLHELSVRQQELHL